MRHGVSIVVLLLATASAAQGARFFGGQKAARQKAGDEALHKAIAVTTMPSMVLTAEERSFLAFGKGGSDNRYADATALLDWAFATRPPAC